MQFIGSFSTCSAECPKFLTQMLSEEKKNSMEEIDRECAQHTQSTSAAANIGDTGSNNYKLFERISNLVLVISTRLQSLKFSRVDWLALDRRETIRRFLCGESLCQMGQCYSFSS